MGRSRTQPCCTSVLEAPLPEAEADELAQAFAALADPIRLRLLSFIAAAGEVCSCDLLVPLDRSQPTISHHTKVLADAGLITGEKRGRWVWWSIVPARVGRLGSGLTRLRRHQERVPGDPVAHGANSLRGALPSEVEVDVGQRWELRHAERDVLRTYVAGKACG